MEDTATHYKGPARLMHWTMALLVLAMVPVGFLMLEDWVSRPLRNSMFVTHKNVGVLLLLLIFARLAYRWRNPPRLKPVELDPMQKLAAKATHFGLYALLLIMPLSGYIRVRAGGFPIEMLDAIGAPSLVPRSDALAAFAKATHLYAGYAIIALIAMHVGAALFHALVKKDDIFERMWPARA
ncbi:cytochrome b561 [Litoreibacter ponti]|uniref:Cytochrome b561 n=1 Tax=Litoreibacter ponti TaxID=1510457 RepID=A0A2T6BN17_9RHOB|nr:cytochrome b [Litoreibacter ponti]PTX57473.1 cytochrome b561 [Litoreibacter ponti]